jgi:hypothetical protein
MHESRLPKSLSAGAPATGVASTPRIFVHTPKQESWRLAALLPLLAAAGCFRTYTPTTPHATSAPEAAADVRAIVTAPAAAVYPPHGAVLLEGTYRAELNAALGVPRLSPLASAPCDEGVAPTYTGIETDAATSGAQKEGERVGKLSLLFRRDTVDREGLLAKPTALDVPVFHANGDAGRACVRVPVVEGREQPEWIESPSWSLARDRRRTLILLLRASDGSNSANGLAPRWTLIEGRHGQADRTIVV